MKVLEIKNNLVKIAYDVKDNLALSGFVIVEDANTPYVAQVVNIKADTAANYAIVKLLFTFNEEGILKNYNGTIPSLKASVTVLPSNELLDIIPVETPIIIGQLAQQEVQLKVDKTIFDNNLLVCSNNLENTSILLNNFVQQIKDKIVIFDTEGQFEYDNKIFFGKDFRLPLNYDTINFIYDNELDDVDATSKAVIQDIFIEVQEYTKTLPEGYLPFDTFLNVVDQQYRETQITQLVLLKNKLLKYRDLNVFAETLKDILNLTIAIENNDLSVIDISDMNPALQKLIISYIYDVMNSMSKNIYSFVKIENSNSDKALLKKLLARTNVYTTIICSHAYKYLAELKEVSQNLLLFAPLTLQHDFASYNTFLNKLNSDEFIIYGAHTQNIPLIVELDEITFSSVEETDESEQKPAESEVETPKNNKEIDNVQEEARKVMPHVEYPDITIDEVPVTTNSNKTDETELIPVNENVQIINEIPPVQNILSEEDADKIEITEPVIDSSSEEENIIIEEPVSDSAIGTGSEEITLEEPEIDYSVDDIDIEENFGEPQIIENNDDIVEQVAKDVDKVFYEKLPQEDLEIEDLDSLATDELTEDDLNLIEDLTNDEPAAMTNELENSITEENPVPVVPVYAADELEAKEGPVLEPGDRVSTPKYGEGVVEKMIKYGNKMLCSIEFPNIGRRLLDPAMSEITKLS